MNPALHRSECVRLCFCVCCSVFAVIRMWIEGLVLCPRCWLTVGGLFAVGMPGCVFVWPSSVPPASLPPLNWWGVQGSSGWSLLTNTQVWGLSVWLTLAAGCGRLTRYQQGQDIQPSHGQTTSGGCISMKGMNMISSKPCSSWCKEK